MYRCFESYPIINSVGCLGATLSPGFVCIKSPKSAAFCQTASFRTPSITGGVSSRGIRTGASFRTYFDGVVSRGDTSVVATVPEPCDKALSAVKQTTMTGVEMD